MSVYTGEPDSLAALVFDEVHQALVDLACEHHLNDVGGLFICDAQPVDELALFADFLKSIRYLGAAAVNQNDLYADEPEQNDVSHYRILQLVARHCVAAVFDNDYLIGVFLYVRQRVDEHSCALRI